jgi:hypothetical protein
MAVSETKSTPPIAWSPETRTWVSLLLFAHLFAVVVAVTAYTRPSNLQRQLHGVFQPYLRNLHLTALPNSYPYARFHLGHAGETDVDFRVEVTPRGVDDLEAAFELPAAPLQPLVRLRRYQALANATGTLGTGELGDAVPSILPKTIAAYALRQLGAQGGEIRIQALGAPDFDQLNNLTTIERASRETVNNVYEAQVIVAPTGVELLRKATTLEIAPIEGAGRNAAPAPAGAKQP